MVGLVVEFSLCRFRRSHLMGFQELEAAMIEVSSPRTAVDGAIDESCSTGRGVRTIGSSITGL